MGTCQADITDLISKSEDTKNAHEEDLSCAENYTEKYWKILYSKIEQLSLKEPPTKKFSEKRKFKLPQIELYKFSGVSRGSIYLSNVSFVKSPTT